MSSSDAVLLIGHGGIPKDAPPELARELRGLEVARQRAGDKKVSAREAELDRKLRQWSRTPENDPYKSGLEAVAEAFRPKLNGTRLALAYNEFCAPSIEEAVEGLVQDGVKRISMVSTMFTPGGSHSEIEIPEIVEDLRLQYPDVAIEYCWPYDLDLVADFLLRHVTGV